MDGTNISVILDDDFFAAYGDEKHKLQHSLAHTVYWAVVSQMRKTAEPGFSVDVGVECGREPPQRLHRGHLARRQRHLQPRAINMARINTLEEMERAVSVGHAFSWPAPLQRRPLREGRRDPHARTGASASGSWACTSGC
jgi:hypothetical protein